MTEPVTVPTIPAEFRPSFTEEPNYTLLGVIADWFEDHGESEAARCLRWAMRTKRWKAYNVGWRNSRFVEDDPQTLPDMHIPTTTNLALALYPPTNCTVAEEICTGFDRLLVYWIHGDPKRRPQ